MPFITALGYNVFDPGEVIPEFTADVGIKIEEIASTASELKYTGAMKSYLMEQLQEPSEDFVRHMALQVFTGRLTENAREKFRLITKKAFTQFISDRVSDRLASALSEEKAANATPEQQNDTPAETPQEPKSKIVTMQEEIDGYNAVKAILRSKVDVKRITIKDTVNYCNVLLDGNQRKPLCRFYFNSPNSKFIGLFGEDRKETRIPLETVDDIYLHTDKLYVILDVYLSSEAEKGAKKVQPSDTTDEQLGSE
ncbi:MAG: hypothetical protein IJP89_04555 [Synergistaceae bacterium]|nr:hypothetical protein [Synergistaceae bacterium]